MFGDLFLCASTIDDADLATRIDAARAGGYQGIGLRPGHLDRALAEGLSETEVRTRIDDAGLELVEIGFLAGWWEGAETEAKRLAHEAAMHRVKAALGGRHIVLISGPLHPGTDLLAERFAGVCDRAAEHGLAVALECLPWTETDSIAKGLAIVEAAGRPNGGLVFDTWHHARGSGSDDELAGLPAERVVVIQVSDGRLGPVESELDATFRHRLPPGEGEFDLAATLGRLARQGVRAPVGVEVLSDELRALAPHESARRVADATREVLAGL